MSSDQPHRSRSPEETDEPTHLEQHSPVAHDPPHPHRAVEAEASGHEHGDDHGHGGHGHSHGLVDPSIVRSRAGVKAVSISLVVLVLTSAIQVAVFVLSGSL